jgi:hypothetical protein
VTEIIRFIAKQTGEGNGILVIVISLAITGILNAEKIIGFLESRKKSQIKRLHEALECAHIDDKLREFIKQEIQREYFLYTYKINAEKHLRDQILELYRNSNGDLLLHHFRRANEYLKCENGKITVKIKTFDKVLYIFNLLLFIVATLLGMLLLVLPMVLAAFSIEMPENKVMLLIAEGSVIMIYSLFPYSQTLPVRSAKKIDKTYKNLNTETQ